MEQDISYTTKSLWNFDDDRMKVLSFYMKLCENAFYRWDLPEIYKLLKSIRRVINGTLNKTDSVHLKDLFEQLEERKRLSENSSKGELDFYNKAEEVYDFMNYVNMKNGYYFRKGEDPRKAIEM